MLLTSPAGAKFWQFELEVDSREIAAGEILHMEAVIAPYGVEQVRGHLEIVPPVEVYRTEDLPASGALPYIEPVQTVDWTHDGEGRFSGRVEFAEPGSYQIVSMKIWNMEIEGYPQPISLTVTEPRSTSVAEGSDNGVLPRWSAVVAAAALTALVGYGFARRRSNLIHAG